MASYRSRYTLGRFEAIMHVPGLSDRLSWHYDAKTRWEPLTLTFPEVGYTHRALSPQLRNDKGIPHSVQGKGVKFCHESISTPVTNVPDIPLSMGSPLKIPTAGRRIFKPAPSPKAAPRTEMTIWQYVFPQYHIKEMAARPVNWTYDHLKGTDWTLSA